MRQRGVLEALSSAAPLASLYLWLVVLYAWQSRWQLTPWLFGDEHEYSALSRSIAETGHAALQGHAQPFRSLYPYLTAPVWLIHDVPSAYSTLKYLDVAVMAAVVFPAYFLARIAVRPLPALFAAAGSAAIPGMIYSSFIIQEPFAYPFATLCLFLIARALVRPGRLSIGLAIGASLVAPLFRDELRVLPGVLVLIGVVLLWRAGRARRWRSRWGAWDWIGFAVLSAGVLVVLFRVLGYSDVWLKATETGQGKHRTIDGGAWGMGSLVIGIGVIPFVLGLAALFPRRGERRDAGERALVLVAATALPAFWLYTAVKASWLSQTFSTLVEERNLIYVAPLLFAATALFLDRRSIRLIPLALSAGLALAILLMTPYDIGGDLQFDAPGLAILQSANRYYAWTTPDGRAALLSLLAIGVAVALALRFARPALAVVLAATVAVGVLGWSVTAEMAAAAGVRRHATPFYNNLPHPLNWIDRATHGQPVIYLGSALSNSANRTAGIFLLEFWNKSIKQVWSTDGTAPPPEITPDYDARGVLLNSSHEPAATGYRYVVTDGAIDLVGTDITPNMPGLGTLRLWRIEQPLRLQDTTTNITSDGWIGGPNGRESDFLVWSTPGYRHTEVVINLSRANTCDRRTTHILVQAGAMKIVGRQPAIGKVIHSERARVPFRLGCAPLPTFTFEAPPAPFVVRTQIWPSFVPHQIDPKRSSDQRHLTAQLSYSLQPLG
ncbi:MAG: hypothetical protein ACXVYM_01080 [Gaiellaceae bacterium]